MVIHLILFQPESLISRSAFCNCYDYVGAQDPRPEARGGLLEGQFSKSLPCISRNLDGNNRDTFYDNRTMLPSLLNL